MNQDIANDNVILYIKEIIAGLEKYFEIHSKILLLNLSDKMNADKWNRVAAILCSLYSIPGKYLTSDENVSRVDALSASYIAREMATTFFPSRESGLEFVSSWALRSLKEIKDRKNNGI